MPGLGAVGHASQAGNDDVNDLRRAVGRQAVRPVEL